MITVTTGTPVKVVERKPYPKLVLNKEYKVIWLAKNSTEGICIFSPFGDKFTGCRYNYITDKFSSDEYEDYNEPVTLCNV